MPFFLGNPYVMAAFAAVAIGVVIYEIVSRQEERTVSHGRRRRPPPRDPPPPPSPRNPPPGPRKPPPSSGPKSSPPASEFGDSSRRSSNSSIFSRTSKSSASSTSSHSSTSSRISSNSSISTKGSGDSWSSSKESRDSWSSSKESRDSLTSPKVPKDAAFESTENHVRRRNINTLKNNEKQAVAHNPSQCETQILSTNKNIDEKDYKKSVYEKILNETMSVNIEAKSNKNISDDDSDSENNISEKPNTKLRNDVSDQPLLCKSNNLSQTNEKQEEMYNKNVLDNLISENFESQEAIGASGGSSQAQNSEPNESIDFNIKQGVCCGCEESPINAIAYPCGHCYLCFDCARKIYRIHKKCTVCHEDIVKFEVQSM